MSWIASHSDKQLPDRPGGMQVYILYPEAVNLAGPSAVHELVPIWELLERVLAVRWRATVSVPGCQCVMHLHASRH